MRCHPTGPGVLARVVRVLPWVLVILLAPGRTTKTLRYYQDIAINRAVEGILAGNKRLLLTLATGTGKTLIAAQIAYKLWNMRWTRKGIGGRRPKILFLADRNFLVDDPYSKDFAIFGEARHKTSAWSTPAGICSSPSTRRSMTASGRPAYTANTRPISST